jgi:hypothetical protein
MSISRQTTRPPVEGLVVRMGSGMVRETLRRLDDSSQAKSVSIRWNRVVVRSIHNLRKVDVAKLLLNLVFK